MIGGAALFGAIVSLFPMGSDIGHWFIVLVVARVGFDIVDRFAAGHFVHAETPYDFPSGGFTRPIKYVLILFAVDFLLTRYARKYGFEARLAMGVATSLILPGVTIVLAMTSSLRSALNPVEWLRAARMTPGMFALLALLALGIDQLGDFAHDAFLSRAPQDIELQIDMGLAPIAVYTAVMVYLWLANFCMVGLALHAGRKVIAIAEQAARAREGGVEKLSPEQNNLSLQVRAGNMHAALRLFNECLELDPMFRPAADDALALARFARNLRESATAAVILRGFDAAHAGHPDIPQVYFFSAQLLAEDLRDPEAARRMLQQMLSRYPGHMIAPEAKRYLQEMGAA